VLAIACISRKINVWGEIPTTLIRSPKTISRVRAEFLGRSLENQVEAWKGTLQYLGLESARLESGI
jgi:hypothetical protein